MFSRVNGGAGVWEDDSLPTFKAMLDDEWYTGNNDNAHNEDVAGCFSMEMKDFGCYSGLVQPNPEPNILLHALNSNSSSATSIFSLDPSQLQSFLSAHQSHQLHSHQNALPSLSDVVGSSSFDATSSCEGLANNNYLYGGSLFNMRPGGFQVPGSSPHSSSTPSLSPHSQLCTPNLSPRMMPNTTTGSNMIFTNALGNLLGNNSTSCSLGLNNVLNSPDPAPAPAASVPALQPITARVPVLDFSRSKTLRPLEVYPSVGAQPTLFQKRAALRHTTASVEGSPNTNNKSNSTNVKGKRKLMASSGADSNDRIATREEEDDIEESIDGCGVHYDTDDGTKFEIEAGGADDGGFGSAAKNANSNNSISVDKGRKKGLPAKNLMAERRRRKKLNDRLYMLRSVVPKISKVEVRTREGHALNIHMFCARRPGLLLSTMRTLDGLGLDVQQAVISCFNGFALDVFRAEQSKGDIAPEEIKAVLLHTASCHAAI